MVSLDDWKDMFSCCSLMCLSTPVVVTSAFPEFPVQSGIDVHSPCELGLFLSSFSSLISKLLNAFITNYPSYVTQKTP